MCAAEMGGIWWRGDREFGVLSGVSGGRGILRGVQETGVAGGGRRDLAGSGGSIGGLAAERRETARSRGIKETGYEGVATFRRRNIFIAEL